MKISIRNKVIIMILFLTLMSVSTLGLMTYRNTKEILIEDMKNRNQDTINNVYDYFFKNFIDSIEYVVEYWAEDEELVNYKNKPNQAKMVTNIPEHFEPIANQWKGFMTANPDLAWMYLGVEEDGSLLINPLDPTMPQEYDCRERDWYIQAVESDGKVIWSDPYLDAGDSGEMVVTVSKAVKRGEELVGVVGIDIKLGKFSEIIKSLLFGDEGHLMLISDNGDIYAHFDRSMLLQNVKGEEWFAETLINSSGTNLYTSKEEVNSIVSYLKMPETNWKLVGIANVDIKDTLAPIKDKMILIALFAMFITVLIGLMLSRVLTKPVNEIMNVINEISEGKMGVRTNISTTDEFKILGKKFNEMIQQIEGLLEERNAHLQELIKKNKEITAQNEEITGLFNDIRRNYLSTVKALANSIDANDQYTRGHCERVRNIAIAIAKRLNYSQIDLNNLEFASLLHDIGKIGIPSELLNKKGELSKDEYEIVKNHPKIASDILEDVEFLRESREIIYQHHERIDGKGYPQQLNAREIALSAKILAVADAYDAMTSIRPYREVPLTKEEAIQELKSAEGSQFDKVVVEAFVNILNEGEIEIENASEESAS